MTYVVAITSVGSSIPGSDVASESAVRRSVVVRINTGIGVATAAPDSRFR